MGWEALESWGDDAAPVEPLSGGVANEVGACASSTDLLRVDTGTKIDLGAMPPEGVTRCRAAWARLAGRPTSVVHGDPNAGNIRITGDRVALIDWDESHVDVSELDLVLSHNAAGLDEAAHDLLAQASAAWEAAVCGDDEYAVGRLAEVRAV